MGIALVVLDIQKDFVGDQARMPVAKHQVVPMIESVNSIIDRCVDRNIPVLYVGNEFEKKQFISNWFRNYAALKGSIGAQLDERLKVASDIYFSKSQGNALSNMSLVNYCLEHGIEHIVIVGLYAEGCVTATAKGALRRGFKATVIRSAVAGANDRKMEKSLRKLAFAGIPVVDSLGFHSLLQ